MKRKKCTVCSKRKRAGQFNVARGRKDGLQSACRDCNAAHCRAYYQRNKSSHIKTVRGMKRTYVARNRAVLLNHLLNHPCVDCGEDDPIVLEFDHVRGKKRKAVTKIASDGLSLETLAKEIAKCDVRCANCHRRRTSKSVGRWMIAALKRQGSEALK